MVLSIAVYTYQISCQLIPAYRIGQQASLLAIPPSRRCDNGQRRVFWSQCILEFCFDTRTQVRPDRGKTLNNRYQPTATKILEIFAYQEHISLPTRATRLADPHFRQIRASQDTSFLREHFPAYK